MENIYGTAEELINEPLELYHGLVMLQLNGKHNGQSIQQLTELLLKRSVETNSIAVLIDLTDTPADNSKTAQYLIDSVRPALKSGTRLILAGVHPPSPQKPAYISADSSDITICPSLMTGLWAALDILEPESANIESDEVIR
ncbi:hypothetical protein ACFLW0_05525 [Chloroflexota bacterium]